MGVVNDSTFSERKSEYIYRDGELVELISKNFEKDNLNNSWKIVYKNELDSLYQEVINLSWKDSIWLNNSKIRLSYDLKNLIIEQTNFDWVENNWNLRFIITNFFDRTTNVLPSYSNDNYIRTYPNPAFLY